MMSSNQHAATTAPRIDEGMIWILGGRSAWAQTSITRKRRRCTASPSMASSSIAHWSPTGNSRNSSRPPVMSRFAGIAPAAEDYPGALPEML